MASLSRILDTVTSPDKGTVLVCVSFLANGTSAPSSSSFKGDLLSSVAWSATGKWTLTLTDGAYDILGVKASVQIGGTDADYTAYAGAVSLSSKTVVAYVRSGGSASNANTDDRICVWLALKRTQVTTRRT